MISNPDTLVCTYDPESNGLDFESPVIRTDEGLKTIKPNQRGVAPSYLLEAIGYRGGMSHCAILHGPGGITIFDGEQTIRLGYEEPSASLRMQALNLFTQTFPVSEIVRGKNLGDGEIPEESCDALVINRLNGDIFSLPFEEALDVAAALSKPFDEDLDITEDQARDTLADWAQNR